MRGIPSREAIRRPDDYGAERVKYIAIHTLSDDAVLGFDGLVDLVRIDHTDGRALVLDLESVAR